VSSSTTIFAADWVLPIAGAPVRDGWIEVTDGIISRLGAHRPPGPSQRLKGVAILPGLVNAHTHVELSWMAGLIPPAASMDEWMRNMLQLRRSGPAGGVEALREAATASAMVMWQTGTALVGDISNSLQAVASLRAANLGGVVFHELIGFSVTNAAAFVGDAQGRIETARGIDAHAGAARLDITLSVHAPYSVSPALFREVAGRVTTGPLAVHVGESPEEIEFLRTGGGPIRRTLERLDVWTDDWTVPHCDPVDYLRRVGYLRAGLLAVHAVHLTDDGLERLRRAGATIVTCPRSNVWVGVGLPRVAHFYASGVPVAIGTDSLASVGSLNLFDELAELRRVAPEVSAASLLDSATRVGAEALGFGHSHGTLAPGKRAALIGVDIPPEVSDVEEYLVSGVPSSAVRRLL
jgi:cytosine/adenosine deaminase-related metal-dependent hydrolase